MWGKDRTVREVNETESDTDARIVAFDTAYRTQRHRAAVAIADTLIPEGITDAWQIPIARRRAACHEALGNRAAAIADYQGIASWYEQHRQRDRAIAALAEILALPALDPCAARRAHLAIADCHQRNGDDARAREHRHRAASIH